MARGEVTQILDQLSGGDPDAMDGLMPLLYHELHKLARHHLGGERPDHTLQPTALVHEAYLRLAGQERVHWQNRAHFFGIASQLMRRILVDYARSRHAEKRGGLSRRISLDDIVASDERAIELIALDDALSSLAVIDPQQSRIVELRFFGGLTIEQTAQSVGVSPATVKRDLNVAKAWLHREIRNARRETGAVGARQGRFRCGTEA
jgi:RNA polymerase sigma-70 factor (ECF subfamily)